MTDRDVVPQIFDGTNASVARRQAVQERLVRRVACKVLFVECICDDQEMVDMNIKVSLLSPLPEVALKLGESALTSNFMRNYHY